MQGPETSHISSVLAIFQVFLRCDLLAVNINIVQKRFTSYIPSYCIACFSKIQILELDWRVVMVGFFNVKLG